MDKRSEKKSKITILGVENDSYYNHDRPTIVNRVPPNAKRILDIGCAAGGVGATIKSKNPDSYVIGIDNFEPALKVARTRLDRVLKMDLNNPSIDEIPSNNDVIICADILEHLLDPKKTLEILRTKISPNGIAIISIPNTRHWSILVPLLANDRFTYTDEGILDKTHVHLFTLTEMRDILFSTGWNESNILTVKIPMPEEIKEKLLTSASLFQADTNYTEYTEISMNAFQYIIDVKPNI